MKALILALGAFAFSQAAAASPCGERIAALETRFNAAPPAAGAQPIGTGGAAAVETTGAKLHHQPGAASAPDADLSPDSEASRRSAHFKVLIEQARAADNSGDARECEASANEAAKALR